MCTTTTNDVTNDRNTAVVVMPLPVVSRREWGSRAPNEPPEFLGDEPVELVFIHHTAGSTIASDRDRCCSTMRGIQNFHMDDRGWDDIGYSFLVGGDGQVYEGRGWRRVGAHTFRYNRVAYGISLMGNFCHQAPPRAMLDATRRLLDEGVRKGYIKAGYGLYGHCDGRVTLCPGEELYKELSSWPEWHARGEITQHPSAEVVESSS